MNLIIDIGNTCVKMTAFDGGVCEVRRTRLGDTAGILAFCRERTYRRGFYCTVVDVPEELRCGFAALPFPMVEYVSGKTPVPIESRYQTPATLGADRMAAAVGAQQQWPGRPVLIIDMGTCVTIDFVSPQGCYMGGNISPGIDMRLKALHHFTGRLPLVEADGPTPPLGNSTDTAIRQGVLTGLRHEVEGYVGSYAKEWPGLVVCLTGGATVDVEIPRGVTLASDPYLVQKGLNKILEKLKS